MAQLYIPEKNSKALKTIQTTLKMQAQQKLKKTQINT